MAWQIYRPPQNDPAWAFAEAPRPNAYIEGVTAYYECRTMRSNPYPEYVDREVQQNYLDWQRGWYTAYQANLNDPTKGRIAHWI